MNKPNSKTFDFSRPETVENDSLLSDAVDRDFGSATDVLADGVSRRRWLQLMGASLALGGAVGCRYQEETIAPFAFRPQNRVPGKTEKFATMLDFGGVAQPVLATCFDGRPVKLDGNPDHEYTGAASTSFTQARILELYDPDRLRGPKKNEGGQLVDATRADVAGALGVLNAGSLKGVAILSGPLSSPTVMRLKKNLESKGASWFTFASISDDNARAGAKAAFGKVLRPHYQLDKAKVIVSIDADPLMMDANVIANNRKFAAGRDVDHSENMCRMYVVESQYSTTGGAADHRISMRSSDMPKFVAALSAAVAAGGKPVDTSLPYREQVLAAMAEDLKKAEGAGVVICGERQAPEVHAAVHALNGVLKNNGAAVRFTEPADADRPPMLESIADFVKQADGGAFQSLVILEGNPVYGAPRELNIAEAIGKCGNTVHLTQAKNETSLVCKTVSDIAHGLEAWGDGLAYDGSVCVSQPLISPLFGSPSIAELLAGVAGQKVELSEIEVKRGEIPVPGMELVQETLGLRGDSWNNAVRNGFVPDSAAVVVDASCGDVAELEGAGDWNAVADDWDAGSLEVVFTPSSSVYDGRFANNAWLQELPDFFTKITWDNAALMSPATAEKLGVRGETLASIEVGDRVLKEMPVCIIPGTADGSIGVALGYGRTEAGRVGGNTEGADNIGVDAGVIRSAADWYVASSATVRSSGTRYRLATIQEPWDFDAVGTDEIENRMFRNPNKSESDRSSMIREGSFESYREFLTKNSSHDHGDHDHSDHDHSDHDHSDHDHSDHSDHDHSDHDHSDHDEEYADIDALSSNSNSKLESLKRRGFDSADGSLPVLNNVAPATPLAAGAVAAVEGDHPDDHGHKHQWPEAFHMHHELFDITPGAREIYRQDRTTGHAWGMSIDLNKCTGCNACVIACQAENNIPVVGKSQVMVGREMHWMRIDRYFGKNLYNKNAAENSDQQVAIQPVTCHHCENAPCEEVCPVAATVHSSEGLNDMVYNRCIGTRYCGNNCPYKVRRFNFFNYSDAVTLIKYPGADKLPKGDRALQNLMMNPEVTIRSRGVMEKCTYCVQRIQNAKIDAKVDGNRDVGANEITTACQDVCPAQAIGFGDLNNPKSSAAIGHASPRAYTMLEELNNHPRTQYLARVRNPHPSLVDHDDRDSVRGGRKSRRTQQQTNRLIRD